MWQNCLKRALNTIKDCTDDEIMFNRVFRASATKKLSNLSSHRRRRSRKRKFVCSGCT